MHRVAVMKSGVVFLLGFDYLPTDLDYIQFIEANPAI